MERYDPEIVKTLIKKIAVGAGVSKPDAIIFADSLVEADVAGTSTHGVSRCNIYIRRIQKGLIDPKATLGIKKSGDAVMSVDANNGLGQVQAVKVLDMLIQTAKDTGIAMATIKNSQHFGTLSYYCNRAADVNMILLATTNCEPSMSPAGGCQAYFGTNPLGVSFPTGKGFHIKVDLATSLVARGNIIAADKKGETIPEGWAQDVDGNPTTDAGKALLGTVLTMSGHKGYALALAAEVLSGVLSGAAVGTSIGSMYKNMDRKQDV
ncbi:MAG: Ldh family oxidoreductase, partial [Desulfotignum balticum]|nr:Ldh family oxidoreductase [Desulfotignum balticum]